MAKLSIVATPIGNLEDITLRALGILKKCDVVACEDTRVTKKLLAHYDISKYCIALHANSLEKDFVRIEKLLEEGKHVVFVSDAGTPGLSDPGLELVSRVREKFLGTVPLRSDLSSGSSRSDLKGTSAERRSHLSEMEDLGEAPEVVIEAIPGPSALAAAISIAGLRAATFTFYGFLPLKKGREKLLDEIAASSRASVLYESPHRILKLLESLTEKIAAPDSAPASAYAEAAADKPPRRIGVFRELTKMHEEAFVGSASEVFHHFAAHPDRVRGEFVVIVEAR